MIKAVIFDLDGTLCDTITDLANAVNLALKKHGYDTWHVNDVRRFVGNGITKLIERSLPEHERHAARIMEVRSDFLVYYNDHCLDETVIYPGIDKALKKLCEEQTLISVVTNKAHNQAQKIIAALFPDIPFCSVWGNRDGIPHKPDTTLTMQALSSMHAYANEAVFIGDSAVDIQTAKNAGMHSIGVTWGYRPREDLEDAKAEKIADSAKDLPIFIKQL